MACNRGDNLDHCGSAAGRGPVPVGSSGTSGNGRDSVIATIYRACAILMVLLCVALTVWRLVSGRAAYDYVAIVFLYLAGTELHLYWRTRRKSAALMAAAYGLVSAANLALFAVG